MSLLLQMLVQSRTQQIYRDELGRGLKYTAGESFAKIFKLTVSRDECIGNVSHLRHTH